ncbi:ABC transporter permease subunit [Bacillus spongiae]|uniref:ABC transporter permease subunit n=1 Tax=Bacillus spongiae TaxID=2683610 RepID=A0ABU8HCR7_9BACI
MIKKLFRNGSFLFGFFILFLLLLTSIVNTEYIKSDHVDASSESWMDKPSPPSWEHPFGTATGEDLFNLQLANTIPTIKLALFITFARMLISILLGFLYGVFYKRVRWLDMVIEGYNFVPATLLALILLFSSRYIVNDTMNSSAHWYFVAFVFIGVGILPLSQLIGKEVWLALQNDYIQSSKVLGARKRRIIFKHVIPSIRGKLFLMLSGQMIQVLTIMLHITVLGFKIPGWGHFIGENYYQLMLSPWIIFFPVLLYTLLIVAITFMSNGVRDCMDQEYMVRKSTALNVNKPITPIKQLNNMNV